MPLVTGPILPAGPVIDVLVAVGSLRRALLDKHGLPHPEPVHVRTLIDTGSSHTLFAPRVFQLLGLGPVGNESIYTPSTAPGQPHECELFDTSLALVANGAAHPFGDRRVIGADCWEPGEGLEGLIGRDVLARCHFMYLGPEQAFTLAFA